jgi:hypothetical protein
LDWWHEADLDHSFEERTIYERSPRLHELLSKDRILKLSEDALTDAISRVHAIRSDQWAIPNIWTQRAYLYGEITIRSTTL